jgi:tetratricopeptide (TPR) repeat protein
LTETFDETNAASSLAARLEREGRIEEALILVQAVAKSAPPTAARQNHLGNLQRAAGRFADAVETYRLGLVLAPREAVLHYNLAAAYQGTGDLSRALDSYQRALQHHPGLIDAHRSLGAVLQALDRHEEALAAYRKGAEVGPQDGMIRADLALCLLRLGQFEEGWRAHEHRFAVEPARPLDAPLWLGDSPLAGRSILLHSEQGLGDTIQFARYIPMVARAGGRVILGAPQLLSPLLSAVEGVAALAPRLDDLPPYDVHCPLMSLPLAFNTRLDNIPWSGPYLAAPEDRVDRWRALIAARGPAFSNAPRIGIAWRGSPLHKNDANRSIALPRFVEGLPKGPLYLVLMNKVTDEERAGLADRPDILFAGDEMADFGDTAALCALCEAVATVDTSSAHLAGAMGKPTLILLPKPCDWRWMLDREDTPWYPTAILLRQKVNGDWSAPLDRLRSWLLAYRHA